MPELTVEAISLRTGMALMSNGDVRPITHMFDENGEDTDDWSQATSCVVKNHEDSWFAVTVTSYDPAALH